MDQNLGLAAVSRGIGGHGDEAVLAILERDFVCEERAVVALSAEHLGLHAVHLDAETFCTRERIRHASRNFDSQRRAPLTGARCVDVDRWHLTVVRDPDRQRRASPSAVTDRGQMQNVHPVGHEFVHELETSLLHGVRHDGPEAGDLHRRRTRSSAEQRQP